MLRAHNGGIDAGDPLPGFLRRERFLDLTDGIVAHEGHPLLAGDPGPGDLADWPWIDFDAPAPAPVLVAIPPGDGRSSLDRLLDRLFRETGPARGDRAARRRRRPVPDGGRPLARPLAARIPRTADRAGTQAAAARLRAAALPGGIRRPALGRGPGAVPPARTGGARHGARAKRAAVPVRTQRQARPNTGTASPVAPSRSRVVEFQRFPDRVPMLRAGQSPGIGTCPTSSRYPNDSARSRRLDSKPQNADCGSEGSNTVVSQLCLSAQHTCPSEERPLSSPSGTCQRL